MIRFGTKTGGMDLIYDGVKFPAPQYGLMRQHGKTVLVMNGYIYLYTLWIVIQDTGIWRQNYVMVLKIGIS